MKKFPPHQNISSHKTPTAPQPIIPTRVRLSPRGGASAKNQSQRRAVAGDSYGTRARAFRLVRSQALDGVYIYTVAASVRRWPNDRATMGALCARHKQARARSLDSPAAAIVRVSWAGSYNALSFFRAACVDRACICVGVRAREREEGASPINCIGDFPGACV